MRRILCPLVLLTAFALPLAAHANPIDQFTFSFVTPPFFPTANLTIDLPASPPPSVYTGENFCVSNCFAVVVPSGSRSYLFNFVQITPDLTFVQYALFFPPGFPPTSAFAFTKFLAPTLFTGSLSNPTFIPGTFDAVYRPFPGSPDFPGTITIEPVSTTTPEPSTFVLLGTGLFGAIATVRRRRVAQV